MSSAGELSRSLVGAAAEAAKVQVGDRYDRGSFGRGRMALGALIFNAPTALFLLALAVAGYAPWWIALVAWATGAFGASGLARVYQQRGRDERRCQTSAPAVAAVLETLAAHYYDRAEQRAQAGSDGDRPQCDGDCGNDDCHMTSSVAAWQMAAATAQRVVAEVREASGV